MGGPRGMGGNFGQWDGPGMMRGGGGRGMTTEQHLVPANRTGLVIGKGKISSFNINRCRWPTVGSVLTTLTFRYIVPGGETIKQINMQSGAHAEIVKNPPPGSDLNYKTFVIKGKLSIVILWIKFSTNGNM